MLAAFYRREVAEIFASELARGQRKIFSAIKKIPHEFVELSCEEKFFNVNTPADLRLARARAVNLSRRTPTISIVAPKSGTGKTTFIERLTKIFAAQGVRVGVIKSDAHGFNLDVEGKDSWRFQTAGAKSVAVVSPKSWFMIEQSDARENFSVVAEKMNVDLILTESRTHGTFPALSLWRGFGEVIADEKVVAIFTTEPTASNEIAQFDLEDKVAAEKICRFDVANFAPAIFALNLVLEKVKVANENQIAAHFDDVLPTEVAENSIQTFTSGRRIIRQLLIGQRHGD